MTPRAPRFGWGAPTVTLVAMTGLNLPRDATFPDPQKVADRLAAMGYPDAVVYVHPEFGPAHAPDDGVPDGVWLAALRGGNYRTPCLSCYQSGDGVECLEGRCARRPTGPGGLILPSI